jgi:hypothetical protein
MKTNSLISIYDCPKNHKKQKDVCFKIATNAFKKDYYVGVGWGEKNSEILFVAMNPRDGYILPCNKKECYFQSSKNLDYSSDRHFQFHKEILSKYYCNDETIDLKKRHFLLK